MINDQKVVAIIQARMSSSRLPGKVLQLIGDKPMLQWVVERTRLAASVDEVIVATTIDPSDDTLASFCSQQGFRCFRGSLYDVLDRFYRAASSVQAQIVVRITADCPLLDPKLVDETVALMVHETADFSANRLPPPWKRTFPIGLDVEVVRFSALERAWKEAKEPFEREHVMPYLYDVKDRFRVSILDNEQDYGSLRWTVDTAEDLEKIRAIVPWLPKDRAFTWLDILEIARQHPEIEDLSAGIKHKSIYDVDERAKL
ncbi:MAG TPA: glycosyltransferase family protein [Longilinea sp.]|nr:glycosyltransferase family protein [Longilinea sp.]